MNDEYKIVCPMCTKSFLESDAHFLGDSKLGLCSDVCIKESERVLKEQEKRHETMSDESYVTFEFGYISDNVCCWDDFCNEVGLNPWLLNEGRADSSDEYRMTVTVAKKYGLIA